MKPSYTSTEWMLEETANELRRKMICQNRQILRRMTKWSGGSNPVLLIKFLYK